MYMYGFLQHFRALAISSMHHRVFGAQCLRFGILCMGVCCRVLQSDAECCSVVFGSVLQCVAVCCSVLQSSVL